jgi:hypothetical protein
MRQRNKQQASSIRCLTSCAGIVPATHRHDHLHRHPHADSRPRAKASLFSDLGRRGGWQVFWQVLVMQATRQRLGVRWQRCMAQACIDDTAFERCRTLFVLIPPSGLRKRRRAKACRTHSKTLSRSREDKMPCSIFWQRSR